MASPFRFFRKHQKAFIATAAVIAMFVFVLADPLMSWLQQSTNGGQRSPTATVASWDGGSLNGRELEMLAQRRYFISNFLQTLQMTGARRVLDEGGTPLQPNVPNFVLRPEENNPRSVMVGVVTTRVVSQLAAEAGMAVSDDMINHYLREFGLRKVTDDGINEILQRVGRGNLRTSEDLLFSGLRELLLANYYMRSYGSITQNVLPEQRWEDWKKINHRIAVEAAVVPTEAFLSQAPAPTEDDLQNFYDRYKDAIAGIDPGFREPQRVRLQYLLGDVTSWTEKLLDSVTEEEISDYYERNKRTQFVKSEITTSETTTEPDQPPTETEDAPADEDATTSDKDAPADEDATTTDEDAPAAEDPPARDEEAAADEDPPATDEQTPVDQDAPAANEDAPAADADQEPADQEPADQEPADNESSQVSQKSLFRLVALQADRDAAPADADSDQPDTPVDESAETIEDAPREQPDEPSAEPSQAPDAGNADEPAAETVDESADESTESETTEEEEVVEYEPLENVAIEIRRSLANDKAVVELQRVMERAYADLQSEFNRYGGEVITAESQQREPPAPPAKLSNLTEMARELVLISEETTLLSQQELADTFVGKAKDAQTGRQPVWHAAFSGSPLYEPFLAQDLDGQWYLALKVEDVASRVPPLDEIRDQVTAAWKRQEAARLALETARQLAVDAEQAGGTLAAFFEGKDYEVVTTDLFSWLTFGTTPMETNRGPRLGEAPPLAAIGREFMTEAFELEPDQVAAQLNIDRTNAYVFRLDRREKTKAELRTLYLTEANNWFGGQVMTTGRWQVAQRRLIGRITQRANLDIAPLQEYLRPDDQLY